MYLRGITRMHSAAYRLAVRVLGTDDQAEDVLQDAYLAALGRLKSGAKPENTRAWFLKIVSNTALMHMRTAARRRRRETRVKTEAEHTAGVMRPDGELVALLRRAMGELEPRYRLPVALCCEEGLSQQEAAEILDLSQRSVSEHLRIGLDRLRAMLARAGYRTAPAAVMASLAYTAPAVPATLATAVEKIVSGQAGAVGSGLGSAGAAVGAAAKGGLAMKAILAVVLAGTVAAGAAGLSAFGFRPSEPRDVAGGPPTVAAGPSDGTPAPVNPFNGMQEREEVFAFAEKPKVAKTGEKWTITFASKGKCDATVTILGPDGKVVRRLASGVLGKNAPYPFQQNSLSQKIEWDGLTDMFQKAPAGCKVKVSLGIQAKFERNLIHDHYDMAVLAKQDYRNDVRLAVAEGPDGSRYLASINGGSVVGKVYDKDGKYLRTFMPPPAAELEKVDDGTGRKIVATKWGDKVIVPFWFGPWAYDNKWLEGDTADYPRVLAKLAGQDGFKLLGKAKSSGDAKQVQEESRPGWLPPAKSTFPFCTSKYVHAAVNPASEEVFLSDPFGISRFDGKTGESFQMPNLPGPFEHAVGPDGLLYALVVRGAYMWRVDREGKEVPFKDGVPIPRNESGPSKGWIIGTWWRPNPPDLAMTVILTGGNHSTNGCMKNGFSVSPAGIAMGMVEFPPAFLAEHKLKGNTPYVSVYSPDGKRLTVDAVGPMAGHGVTIDRDGNLYVAYTGLPDGQKVLDGMDPSSAGSGHPGRVGAGSLVKYRGLGGKFPLNVGPGQKFTGGKELPGSLWAYGGIVGQTGAGCGCGHVRVVIDGWARNWIPANHLCSVTVIDSNGNRIARLGRYGNVDDTEADLKAGKDGLRFCWPRAVVASDTALYVADVGNRRVLKAALSYAAEETVPAP